MIPGQFHMHRFIQHVMQLHRQSETLFTVIIQSNDWAMMEILTKFTEFPSIVIRRNFKVMKFAFIKIHDYYILYHSLCVAFFSAYYFSVRYTDRYRAN